MKPSFPSLSYSGEYSDVFTDSALLIIFTTVTLNGVLAGPLVRSLTLTDRGAQVSSQCSQWASYTWWEERYLRPVLHQAISLQEGLTRTRRTEHFKTNKTGLGSDNLAFDMQEKQEDSSVDLNKDFNSVVNF